MTEYTANNADTYWDQPTHFTPNGTPGAGDTIVVPSNYRLHVVGTRAIGTSAAMGASRAIELKGGANNRLILAEDSFLRFHGEIYCTGGGADISQHGGVLFYPGSTLWHDSTGATDPTNQHYGVQLGSAAMTFAVADFTNSNNPAKRVTIGSEAGGGRGWFDVPNFERCGGADSSDTTGYVDHIRWGGRDSTNYAYTARWNMTGTVGNSWYNMTFDDCGGVSLPSLFSGARPVFKNLYFTNTKTQYTLNISNASAITNQGLCKNLALDKAVYSPTSNDWDFEDIVCGQKPVLLSSRANVDPLTNVVVITQQAGGWGTWGGNANGVVVIKDTTAGNPHFIQSQSNVATNVVTRYVAIYTGPALVDSGDAIVMAAGNHILELSYAIVLDDRAHTSNDHTLFSMLGGNGARIRATNCTCIGREAVTGETDVGVTDQIAEFKDNLMVNLSVATRYKLRDLTGTALNPVLPANAHHNGGFGHAAGSNGKGYHNMNLNPDDGTIGANDLVNVNPAFKRELYLEDFDADQGGAGTMANAIANLLRWNHPTNPPPGDYSPANLLDAFLGDNDNWAPSASEYNGSSSTGATMGAKGWKAPAPVATGGCAALGPGVIR